MWKSLHEKIMMEEQSECAVAVKGFLEQNMTIVIIIYSY